MQSKDMSLVLSTDAKPRLKWTPELHQRFIEAVTQLGGADKATPKTLMRVMGIPGLTLYHLKSHLQKYRLGKHQQSEACNDGRQEEFEENQRREGHLSREVTSDGRQSQSNESLQIAQALEMQMEVQRKLHEQIEVQRHLQLRIEAQGKYLHSVLKKAQETLAGRKSSGAGVELAKAELSQLISMVDSGSSMSDLTGTLGTTIEATDEKKSSRGVTGGSMDSSLTSSESSGRNGCFDYNSLQNSGSLPSLEIKLGHDQLGSVRKRSGSTVSDGNYVQQPPSKRSTSHKDRTETQFRNFGLLQMLDLNNKYQNGMDSGPEAAFDLNCKGVEEYSGHLID